MKNIFCIILSVLLLLSSLTACGNIQTDTQTTGEDEKTLEETSIPASDITAEETTEENTAENISEGEIAVLSGMFTLYAASVDSNTVCFVVQDVNDNKKAVFLNKKNNSVISETVLSENEKYYSVADKKLIVADSTATIDGAYRIMDKNGNVIDKKPYVINSVAEEDSEILLSVLAGTLKRLVIDGNTGDMLYIAYKETYLIDGSTGEKTKLEFFSNENVPIQIESFAGGNILIVKTNDSGRYFTLWSTNGNKINEFSFPEIKDITCVGNFAVIFSKKNLTGISSDNKINLLNILTGEIKELSVETNKENQWCTVSSDGKYILTLDYDFNFRLYDTESGELIEKFNVDGLKISPLESRVLIDSESKSVYIGLMNNNDVYGVYVKQFLTHIE